MKPENKRVQSVNILIVRLQAAANDTEIRGLRVQAETSHEVWGYSIGDADIECGSGRPHFWWTFNGTCPSTQPRRHQSACPCGTKAR